VQASGFARIVHRVGVEQHLRLALQPLEQLGARRVGRAFNQPGVHRAANHAVQAGAGNAAQRLAAGVPAGGTLKVQGDTVFGAKRRQRVKQGPRVGIVQAQLLAG